MKSPLTEMTIGMALALPNIEAAKLLQEFFVWLGNDQTPEATFLRVAGGAETDVIISASATLAVCASGFASPDSSVHNWLLLFGVFSRAKKEEAMTDQPKRLLDPELLRRMENSGRKLGKVLDGILKDYAGAGERMGFALMIFAFDGPEFTWVSNANRADMVKAMQEFINRNPPNQTSDQRN